MGWASWTTTGIYSAAGGVLTEEQGLMSGDLTLHTTWTGDHVLLSVQYTGASEWFTLAGGRLPCASEEESREVHQRLVEAVRHSTGHPATAATLRCGRSESDA
ncbi:hypothetical protein [Streptomyces subrutilus]|uniref:Uncharacterized protein n=1 Tax=Streptomyces subrutilus TaxID=36818 RepID=A0A918QGB2_9ACTN|nr:hypothetical protein [Streptomyces subrutilus]WSJ33453.1 hypothetical protein OG479_31420 [Streptomyces subrutilus]GGZ47662.1 hypothetical protein GCM10010371_03760 [Streptomyces subrutilus]